MKKNSKKIILISSLVLIIIIIVVILVMGIINDKKESSKNMELINDNYELLGTNVNEYNQIRSELSNKLNNFIYADYEKEHNEYVLILTKYNNNINLIDDNVKIIDSKCNVIYNDISVNKICDSYKVLYEKLINLYVMDLNNYNRKIGSYNEYKKEDISLFNMIHSEYIDYNDDGKYEGVVSDGEEE